MLGLFKKWQARESGLFKNLVLPCKLKKKKPKVGFLHKAKILKGIKYLKVFKYFQVFESI